MEHYLIILKMKYDTSNRYSNDNLACVSAMLKLILAISGVTATVATLITNSANSAGSSVPSP